MRRFVLSFSLVLLQFSLSLTSAHADTSEYSESLRQVKTGEEMLTILQKAKEAGVDLDALPAPPREALRHYFGEHLFYNFKPDLFWPHYPDNWRQGMRNVYRHALEQDYKYENRYHAVEHLDLFFTQDQISDLFLPEVMIHLAWLVDRPMDIGRNTSRIRRQQMNFWLQGIMAARNSDKQLEVIKELGDSVLRYAEIKDWLDDNPESFIAMLRHGEPGAQQNWLAYHRPVPIDHPEVFRVILESLQDDQDLHNQRFFSKFLFRDFEVLKGQIREAFLESRELQQKSILCDILILKSDERLMPEILEFLWKSLADSSKHDLIQPRGRLGIPGYYGEGSWWTNEPRIPRRSSMLWATYRLCQIGDRAVSYLLSKTNQCVDAQQLAFSLLIIQIKGQEHRIQWTELMIDLLMEGLEDNNVEYDQGITALAIKRLKGSPELLEGMKRYSKAPSDEQQGASLSMLIKFYTNPKAFHEMRKKVIRFPRLGYVYKKDWYHFIDEYNDPTEKGKGVIYWEYYQMMPALGIEE